MKELKVWRLVCAYGGIISLIGVCAWMPALFKFASFGEIKGIDLLLIVIGVISLLTGVLRFLLSAKAQGMPFLLAALAFLAALLGLSPLLRSVWLILALLISVAGTFIGFRRSPAAPASGS
jgi:hypothetical protein